jgi:hypothetical protein
MNKYLIEHKIRTLAELWDKPFEHEGFEFRQWDFAVAEGSCGDAWIARKGIEASSAQQAINTFRSDLLPIVDKVAFVSQCYTTSWRQ